MANKIKTLKFIPGKTRITYGATIFEKEEREAIEQVLDRNWWALNGEGLAFEKELANYIGKKHCLLVNSGSSALLLALASLKLPKGTGVVIPAVTFPTNFNAILQNQLLPYVVDSDKETLNLRLDEVEKALRMGAKAIIAVHIVGNPVNMPELMSLARRYQALVIEDNCDGLGGDINGKKLGSFGHLSCISMYAGHIINMGEGGAILTDDNNLAKILRSLRDWGRLGESDKRGLCKTLPPDYPERYVYSEIGYNLKPLELQAAMGRVQLRRISQIKRKRRENFNRLKKIFIGKKGISLISSPAGSHPCWYAFPLLAERRIQLMKFLEEKNIETRPIFAGNILRHPAYKKVKVVKISNLPNADEILNKGFYLGVHPLIPEEAFSYIKKVVDQFFKN